MGVLREVISKRPLAAAAFAKWLSAREVLSPLSPHLRESILDAPTVLVYGVVIEFLAEHGVLVTFHITPRGRQKVVVHRRRPLGSYIDAHRSRIISGQKTVMNEVVHSGFAVLDKMIAKVTPPKESAGGVLIGLDVDQIVQRANESLTAWRN